MKLEDLSLDDAEELAQLVEENREFLRRTLHWVDYNRGVEDSRRFVERMLAGRDIVRTIRLEGRIVGMVHLVVGDPLIELGYWIEKASQGKGLVTKACRQLLLEAFEERGIHRVTLHAMPVNEPSIRVAERLGFVLEGRMREACPIEGRFEDFLVYGLLKHELV